MTIYNNDVSDKATTIPTTPPMPATHMHARTRKHAHARPTARLHPPMLACAHTRTSMHGCTQPPKDEECVELVEEKVLAHSNVCARPRPFLHTCLQACPHGRCLRMGVSRRLFDSKTREPQPRPSMPTRTAHRPTHDVASDVPPPRLDARLAMMTVSMRRGHAHITSARAHATCARMHERDACTRRRNLRCWTNSASTDARSTSTASADMLNTRSASSTPWGADPCSRPMVGAC